MVRNKKNHRSKKVWIVSLTGAMLIAVSAAFLWIPSFASQSDKIAVTINGLALPVELLEEEMKTAVPKVYSYFESEHQVEDVSQNGFWETSFDGERPIDYARQLVLEKWVRYTVVLQEAKKNDLIQDITYVISIRNSGSGAKVASLEVDGEKVEGVTFKAFQDGKEHHVTVELV